MLVAMVALDLSVPRLVARIIDKVIKQKDKAVVAFDLGLDTLHVCLERPGAVLNSNSSIRVGRERGARPYGRRFSSQSPSLFPMATSTASPSAS